MSWSCRALRNLYAGMLLVLRWGYAALEKK